MEEQHTSSPRYQVDQSKWYGKPPQGRCAPRLACRSWSSVLVLLVAPLLTGCAQLQGSKNFYAAHEIPGSLVAQPTSNAQQLDLTKLAVSGGAANEIIGVGDVLDVSVSAGPNHRDQWSLRVDNQGAVNLPYGIGPVPVGGQAPEEAEAVITQTGMQRGVYRAPSVSVAIKKKRTVTVTVLGAVNSPGPKTLSPNRTDLLSVLVAAGGLAPNAGTSVEIQNVVDISKAQQEAIARGGNPGTIIPTGYSLTGGSPKSVQVDLVSAVTKGSNGYFVGDGGVVMVETRDPKAVTVSGLVRKPGAIEFPMGKDFFLLDALTSAGWVSSQVADKVYVIRQSAVQGGEPSVIQCSIARAKHDPTHNIRLAAGDTVSVEHSPATVVLEALGLIRLGFNLNPFF